MTVDFKSESAVVRRQWNNSFKNWKKKSFKPKCYTQTKYPSKNEEQRSIDREVSSLDREKVREFATSVPALQELLEEILLDDIISERYYVKDNIWQT